jgi:hypothetical protein
MDLVLAVWQGLGHAVGVRRGEGSDGTQSGDNGGQSWPRWRRACLGPDLGPFGPNLGWRALLPTWVLGALGLTGSPSPDHGVVGVPDLAGGPDLVSA